MTEKGPEEKVKLLFHGTVRLNSRIIGLVLGLLCGLGIFLATNFLLLKGTLRHEDHEVGRHLSLLSQFFIGYKVTFVGSLIGFVYGFAVGTIAGTLMGWIYNKIVDLRH